MKRFIYTLTQGSPLGASGLYAVVSIFVVGGYMTNEPIAIGMGVGMSMLFWVANFFTYKK